MLKSIVPSRVFLETLCELEDYPLSPEEELSLGRVVQNRKREFATGRACAHRANRAMGLTPSPILVGAGREPIWPSGVTGSITHCRGLCAAAVASSDEVRSIGLDWMQRRIYPYQKAYSRLCSAREIKAYKVNLETGSYARIACSFASKRVSSKPRTTSQSSG